MTDRHAMDIQALQHSLRNFAAARHWQPFHTPKNLSAALMVEAAELLEIFQWMTPEESQAAHLNPATKAHIADEVADVLLYLLQVTDHCHIDLSAAVANKLVKNAIKHPAPDAGAA
jgi:NTP pyrophosphatase (non-canonical NTP hydrolase)